MPDSSFSSTDDSLEGFDVLLGYVKLNVGDVPALQSTDMELDFDFLKAEIDSATGIWKELA